LFLLCAPACAAVRDDLVAKPLQDAMALAGACQYGQAEAKIRSVEVLRDRSPEEEDLLTNTRTYVTGRARSPGMACRPVPKAR
jgi:hypothetical protein